MAALRSAPQTEGRPSTPYSGLRVSAALFFSSPNIARSAAHALSASARVDSLSPGRHLSARWMRYTRKAAEHRRVVCRGSGARLRAPLSARSACNNLDRKMISRGPLRRHDFQCAGYASNTQSNLWKRLIKCRSERHLCNKLFGNLSPKSYAISRD